MLYLGCVLDGFVSALGSDQANSAKSSETQVRQVLGFRLVKEQVGSLHLFVANACCWNGCY
jgi:hypothetical protein